MRFFIYCRKSSDREDRQILGPEAQRRLMLDHAQRHGLTVVDVYVEHKSAYKIGRPLFNTMLQRLEAGEADGILTYHLTRLARNSFDGGRIIYMMDDGTLCQIATPEKTYTNDSDDKFMMSIHFAMAKKSSDDTSQFVRRDVDSKLLRGEYPGMVPIGYLNISRDGHITRAQDNLQKYMTLMEQDRPLRREEIDPIDGPLVARFFEEVAKGRHSVPQLRKLSFRMGLRSRRGAMLNKNAVRAILTNPYYYGVIRYRGRIYDNATIRELSGNPHATIQHEPLISRTLFEQVQLALTSTKKSRYRKHRFAFGGCVLRCGECGAPVTAERQKGHVYYHCVLTHGRCSQRRWTREDDLSRQFATALERLRLPPSYLDCAFGQLRLVHKSEVRTARGMRCKLQNQLNATEQKLDGLLQLKIAPENRDGGLLTDAEYARQKLALRKEADLLQEQLATLGQQRATWIDDCERFLSFTQRLAQTFERSTVEDKQTMLNMLCANLTLTDQRLAYVYREPYATVAAFSPGDDGPNGPFEPVSGLEEGKKSENEVNWLHILTAIRTYPLREYVLTFARP